MIIIKVFSIHSAFFSSALAFSFSASYFSYSSANSAILASSKGSFSSSGVKSLTMLNLYLNSGIVNPLIMLPILAQDKSKSGLISI